eukprot:3003511-Amphidinium_carterae.2
MKKSKFHLSNDPYNPQGLFAGGQNVNFSNHLVSGAEEVAYYDIEDVAGEAGSFTLTCKKSIEFHASEENPKNV